MHSMPDTGFISVFLIGLLGGTHCVVMCGGIVSAITVNLPNQSRVWQLHLGYNTGRILSYTLAGAAMGSIGSLGLLFNDVLPVQLGLYIAANLMLVALGLYLIGLTQSLSFLERIGQSWWRRIQPYTQRFLPARSFSQALSLGMLWGWLPCGMVYSVLAAALLAGNATRGAGLMLAFGLGTLPNLLLAGLVLKRLQAFVRAKSVRLAAGLLVSGFGVFGLINSTTLGGRLWQGICHV
jgi:sulfite exporter TauE/SafE